MDASTLPGAAPLPLIGGRADLLRFFADPIHHLLAARARGRVVAMTAGRAELVFAFGADHNHAVLSDPATWRNAVEVPVPLPADSAATRIFRGLMSMNGEEHRRHRRLLLPAVNKAAVASHAADIVEVSQRHLARWTGTFDVVRAAGTMTTAVLLRCLFDAEAEDDAIGPLSARLLGLFSSPATLLVPLRVPGLPYTRFLSTCEEVEARVRAMIAAGGAEGRRDVLSMLLRARAAEDGGITDDQLVAHMVSMVFAGQDAVAGTLVFALLLLAQHPDVARDLVDELDATLGGAEPTPDTRLPLLDGVLNETMRLLPPIAHLLFRRPAEAMPLGAHVLPAGATLVLSPLVTHREPEVFPEPLRFDPGRWTGAAPGPYAYLPYGAGPRTCLGAGLASSILRVQLALILRGHRPVLAGPTRVDLTVRAANLVVDGALPMRLVPRGEAPRAVERVDGSIRRLVALA